MAISPASSFDEAGIRGAIVGQKQMKQLSPLFLLYLWKLTDGRYCAIFKNTVRYYAP